MSKPMDLSKCQLVPRDPATGDYIMPGSREERAVSALAAMEEIDGLLKQRMYEVDSLLRDLRKVIARWRDGK